MEMEPVNTVKALKEAGIDPSDIPVDGIYGNYYQVIQHDPVSGKRMLDMSTGILVTRDVPWPSQEIRDKVLEAYRRDVRGLGLPEPEAPPIPADINRVVLLRRQYDMELTGDASRAWIDAENTLSPEQYEAYQELYRNVTNGTATRER